MRSVLVTGASSGIGAAVAESFGREGAHVVSLDLVEAPAASLSVIGDVTDPRCHAEAVAAAVAAAGRLDVLIANAGVHDGGIGLASPADEVATVMRRVFDVDVIGYVLAIHAAEAALRDSRGCIVMTLSDTAFLAGQTGAGLGYTAAKYAAHGVLKWAARALAPDVRVNGVAPGGIMTRLQAVEADGSSRGLFTDADAKRELIRSRNPLGTIMEPEELAELYVLLASPVARGMTGEVLRPDGGLGVR